MSLWPGLLSWSTSYSDGTRPSNFQPMDENRKHWLQNALESAFSGQLEDQNVRLQRALVNLTNASTETDQAAAIDEIDACADFPDCCGNFAKLRGIDVAVSFLSSVSCLKPRFLSILSLYIANNPLVQTAAYEAGLTKMLIDILNDDKSEDELKLRAVSLLGAVIRGVDALENGFVQAQGVEFLRGVHCNDERVKAKLEALTEHLVQIDSR
jgi:hypothetical protein